MANLGSKYTDFTKVRTTDLKLAPGSTQPTAEGQITYVDGTGFRGYGESGAFTFGAGGGGGGSGSLDSAYSVGHAVTLDEGAVDFTDATTGALHSMTFTQSGAKSGNVLDFVISGALTGNVIDIDMDAGVAAKGIYIDNGAGARTGADFQVKSDSTGTHSVIDIDASGSGAVTGFDFQGSYTGSPAGSAIHLTLDANDNLDTLLINVDTGAGERGVMFDYDFGHTDSGTTSHIWDIDVSTILDSNIFDFATGAACTGNVFSLVMDNGVAMTALRVTGAGVRTQPFIELIGTQTGSADMIDLSADGAFTGDFIAIDMNAAVGANAIFIDAGAATRTAPLMLTTFDGDGTTTGGTLWDINVTNTGAAANPLFDIDVTGVYTGNIVDVALGAASTGSVINVDMNLGLAAPFCTLDAGNGIRTADLFDVTFDGSGNVGLFDINHTNTGSGNLFDIDVSGVHTGKVFSVVYSAAATGDCFEVDMTSAVAAKAFLITGAGARTDDLFEINDSSTASGASIFDINVSGINTGPVLDIVYSVSAITGDMIVLDLGTGVAASAITIAGAGARTDDMIKIDDSSTGNSHIFDINFSGIYTGNCLDITYGTDAATGNAISLAMGTNVGGQAILMTTSATGVSGEGSALDITHDGNLVAGANLVDIISTGSPSATSHLVSLQQTTGAGSAGAYVLYLNATGANVEALKVDAGKVVFDETLEVSGATTLTGAVTATAGVQSSSLAVTATADGLTTGLITAGTRYTTVTCDNVDKIVTLPAATVGNIITLYVGANGCEVRTPAGSNVTINNIDSDGTNEAAIPATTLATFTCTGTTSWILEAVDELGAVITAIIPDAA